MKSVNNGIGGVFLFGIADAGQIKGVDNAQKDSEIISRLIKERIKPLPQFVLSVINEAGKNLVVLSVTSGRSTPYYYKADGVMEAYTRVGNETIVAPDYLLNELILKGKNQSYDSLVSDIKKSIYSFTQLEATYRERTGMVLDDKDYSSFGLAVNGYLTNAGRLLTDQHIVYNSCVFCTRWNGLDKGSIFDDALDDKEYEGNLIYLLQSAQDFIKNNSKVRFEKKDEYRVDKPDYSMRAVTEALVNALIHRDYIIMGSEIHIDMYDDRVEIQSPGGMFSGKPIQEYDLDSVGSMRRNPVLADLFHRMKFMERRGSGLRKMVNETKNLPGYEETMKPEFISTLLDFRVVLKNVNYNSVHNDVQDSTYDGVYDSTQDKIVALLDFCEQPRSSIEMAAFMQIRREYFFKKYLKALLADGRLKMTLLDKPKSKNQKYVRVK